MNERDLVIRLTDKSNRTTQTDKKGYIIECEKNGKKQKTNTQNPTILLPNTETP